MLPDDQNIRVEAVDHEELPKVVQIGSTLSPHLAPATSGVHLCGLIYLV